jgi:hypothetical protein
VLHVSYREAGLGHGRPPDIEGKVSRQQTERIVTGTPTVVAAEAAALYRYHAAVAETDKGIHGNREIFDWIIAGGSNHAAQS